MRCALPAASRLTLLLLLSAALQASTVVAQGPGWVLGEPDDCQRKEIAAEPHKHRFWTDAAPVTLYQYAYLQPAATGPADPADGPPRRRIQLQKRRVDALDLWSMDQGTPAFDFSYSLVGGAPSRINRGPASAVSAARPGLAVQPCVAVQILPLLCDMQACRTGRILRRCCRATGTMFMSMSCSRFAVRPTALTAMDRHRRRPTRQRSPPTQRQPGRSS